MKTGNYKAKCVDVCLGYTKSGSQMIEMLMEAVDEECAGERISCVMSFSGKAAPYTLDRMRLCGWKDLQPIEDVMKNVVEIRVYDDEYEGKVRQKCEIVTPQTSLRTGKDFRMGKRDAAEFLRSLVTPENATPPAKPMRQMGDDEDLPY